MVLVIIMLSFIFNNTNSLSLLLSAEVLWVCLYAISVNLGFYLDNINILSLTFFFLIFSAVEFSVGLIIIFFQYVFFRSISFSSGHSEGGSQDLLKINKVFLNRFNWNF